MSRKLPVLFFSLFLLSIVSTANAQTTTTAGTTAVPAVIIATPSTATDAATKLKLQMQLLQEQKAAALAKVKSDASAAAQVIKDSFKAKLLLIKDQRKQALVERINTKITEVNTNQTTRFLESLASIQGFLDKFKLTATGIATSTSITVAQKAIDTAKSAVEAQAAKTYTMSITDDVALKQNVGATASQFRLDLVAVYKLVINAKQAVQKLNPEKVILKKEATSSAGI